MPATDAETGSVSWADQAPQTESNGSASQWDPGVPVTVADNSFAWALACTPLLYLLVNAVLAGAFPESARVWGLMIAIAVNSTLAVLDHRRLPEDTRPDVRLGLILIPIYLFQRSSRLRQAMTIPVVWCAAFAVSLFALASGVGTRIDPSAVEQSIESEIRTQVGVTVTAECPSGIAVKPGSTFQCTAKASDGSIAIVDVSIQNTAGDIVWQVRR